MLLLLFMEIFAEIIIGIVVAGGGSHCIASNEFITSSIDAFARRCQGGGAGTVINESQFV